MSLREELESVLRGRGEVEALDWPALVEHHEDLARVHWNPLYAYRVGEEVWAVDIFRGPSMPRSLVLRMATAREHLPGLRPAFLVPEDENVDSIAQVCLEHGIDVVAMLGGAYRLLPLDGFPEPTADAQIISCRLPPLLVQRIAQIQSLDDQFGDGLREFAQLYLQRIDQPGWDDAAEEHLLHEGLTDLLRIDPRFEAPYKSLGFLRQVEKYCSQESRRDHYFHAFHTFLLGCRVIDQCEGTFGTSIAERLGVGGLSCAYLWLLTALFHDVGYLQGQTDMGLVSYGTDERDVRDEETELGLFRQQRLTHWDYPDYQNGRTQLAHLWQYLYESSASPPWHPATLVPDGLAELPFDIALREAYLSGSHGVAGALRLLTDFRRLLRQESGFERPLFWSWHIYLAALSIPFHDRLFRLALRDIGVQRLSTRQFPFAALLTFIDSIQEDRRSLQGAGAGPDILQDITVESTMVRPQVDWENLTPQQLDQIVRKRDEIVDVATFLDPDGLEYVYPAQLLGSLGANERQ